MSMLKFSCCLLPGLVLSSWLASANAAPDYFSEQGYRIQHYRSPTPTTNVWAQVITAEQLLALRTTYPELVLVDVYRNPWLHGQFTATEPHANLPGSLWLANCGDGVLSEAWLSYCQQYLAQATADNFHHPIVFYCRSDCWLGWNASQRAYQWGYRQLYWLRNGIDEWQQQGLPLVTAQPAPFTP